MSTLKIMDGWVSFPATAELRQAVLDYSTEKGDIGFEHAARLLCAEGVKAIQRQKEQAALAQAFTGHDA